MREFLLFLNRWWLIGEMVRHRMVLQCFHSLTGEVCAGMPHVQYIHHADTNIYSSTVSVQHAVREAEVRERRKHGALRARFRFDPVTVETASVHGERSYLKSVDVSLRQRERVGRPFDWNQGLVW